MGLLARPVLSPSPMAARHRRRAGDASRLVLCAYLRPSHHPAPEEPNLAAGGAMTEGEMATRLACPASPSRRVMIGRARAPRISSRSPARATTAHVSTPSIGRSAPPSSAPAGPAIQPAAYFALNETAVGEYRNICQAIAPCAANGSPAGRRGAARRTIDAIASDHAPHDQDSKRLPFNLGVERIIGLETLLPLSLELI